MEKMHRKFAFFGTPYVARDTLSILLANGYRPEVIITNPDTRSGRGLALTPTPTKALALEAGIAVYTPEKLDAEAIRVLRTYECEYAVVVAYGKIFPQELIETFPKGAINVHYSLLPRYRGASPVEAALLSGEAVTGVTVQHMALALDAGNILAYEEVSIGVSETAKELKPRLIVAGANLLVKILPSFEQDLLTPTPQDEAHTTFCKKIKKEDGALDLSGNAKENWNKYRAYAEWPGTHFFEDGKRIKIVKASYKNNMFVIERVTPEGKREMDYTDFTRGRSR
jgi:methionyl-tRNA formyltransferase